VFHENRKNLIIITGYSEFHLRPRYTDENHIAQSIKQSQGSCPVASQN